MEPEMNPNNISLSGKTVLVTGASSGLGERFARVLAGAGASVALAARRTARLETLKSELERAGGKACAVAMDVTQLNSIKEAVAAAETALGPIDILVNNSGTSVTRRAAEMTEADYDVVMDTNTKGAFFVAQAVGKGMIARKAGGRIINIASVAGLRALSQVSVYCMSKAAAIHMTRALALEWGRYNINVNAICPGYIETEINRDHFRSEAGQKLVNMLPRRRIGTPADLDGLLLLLASDLSGFINGSIITADDGLSVT
jgi:NAD(P)-dependent dehydrogenase (short-subunit alcohol dehydrogenase family)